MTRRSLVRNRKQTWCVTGLMMAVGAATTTTMAVCQPTDDETKDDAVHVPPFDESLLSYDHYNGVTLHLDGMIRQTTHHDKDSENNNSINSNGIPQQVKSESFAQDLEEALKFWKAEGRKGIWVHCSTENAHLVPHCVKLGFKFHFVKNEKLILSQWLPETESRLPFGPTHQVGVGTVVLHPTDPSKMLVVKEKTGPAAAFDLWKMPTGLLDPGEDIPDAAIRELKEETGLDGVLEGIVCFRQAHSPTRTSDLFFVCRMSLKDPNATWKPQEEEIAAIDWMSVEDYCNQDRWQGSPVYMSLNDSIRKASQLAQKVANKDAADQDDTRSLEEEEEKHSHGSKHAKGMILHERLPLGFSKGTNAFYRSQL